MAVEKARGTIDLNGLNVSQYFWHDSEGAHVSGLPQNISKENLLLKDNGIYIRKGTIPLATFTDEGIQIGQNTKMRAYITTEDFSLKENGTVFKIGALKENLDAYGNYTSTNTVFSKVFNHRLEGAQGFKRKIVIDSSKSYYYLPLGFSFKYRRRSSDSYSTSYNTIIRYDFPFFDEINAKGDVKINNIVRGFSTRSKLIEARDSYMNTHKDELRFVGDTSHVGIINYNTDETTSFYELESPRTFRQEWADGYDAEIIIMYTAGGLYVLSCYIPYGNASSGSIYNQALYDVQFSYRIKVNTIPVGCYIGNEIKDIYDGQLVLGCYPEPSNDNILFTIGNGTSATYCNSSLNIYRNGDIFSEGEIWTEGDIIDGHGNILNDMIAGEASSNATRGLTIKTANDVYWNICWGQANITPNAPSGSGTFSAPYYTDYNIDLLNKKFSENPRIWLQLDGRWTGTNWVTSHSITTTSFKIRLYTSAKNNTARTVKWLAIGKKSTML